MQWFDVALWREWPAPFPTYIGYVEAVCAFEAVERAMYGFRLSRVVHAAACALDGSLCYRAFRVRVVLEKSRVGVGLVACL